MKKIYIILNVMLILLVSLASAFSTDPTDYYFDGIYYITDGVSDLDIGLDGSVGVHGPSVTTTGWGIENAGGTYDNTVSSLGTVSIRSTGSGYTGYYDMPNDDTFTGWIGIKIYVTHATHYPFFVFTDSSDTARNVVADNDATNWRYASGSDCDENTIPVQLNKWANITFDFTSGTDVLLYIGYDNNNLLCHEFTGVTGIRKFRFGEVTVQPTYFDELWISEGERPGGGGEGEEGNFSLTAFSAFDSSAIDNFSAIVNGTFYNTTTGTIATNISNNLTSLINITVDSIDYFDKSYFDYNVSSNLVALLDPINSVLITIRNELTNNLIYDNVSVKFQNNQSEVTYYTNSSLLFLKALDSGEYYITFDVLNTSLDYVQKSYVLTISNSSTSVLNAYITQNSSVTVFTISDKFTSGLLENVLATSYKMINNTWVTVQSGLTDITGKISFQYLPYTRYKFYLAKESYEYYIFYLNPVTSSTYDIKMDRISQINESQDYDQIALIYAPKLFYGGVDNNFTFLIQSPYGELVDYGYALTFPGGTASNSGTNALGSQLYNNFTIYGATVFDRVQVDYYYETVFAGRRDFTYYYPISLEKSEASGNNTMVANRDKTYGLGLFERIFISVFLVFLFVGIATLIGQPTAGFGIGLLLYGFFIYVGFIPLWSCLITITIGLIILGSRPGS